LIELNEQQRQELSAPEPMAIDPATNTTYVLVREDLYQRIKGILYDAGEWNDESLRSQLAISFQGNGWDYPKMDEYDKYDEVRAKSCQ
jgi:hypothetical protein